MTFPIALNISLVLASCEWSWNLGWAGVLGRFVHMGLHHGTLGAVALCFKIRVDGLHCMAFCVCECFSPRQNCNCFVHRDCT